MGGVGLAVVGDRSEAGGVGQRADLGGAQGDAVVDVPALTGGDARRVGHVDDRLRAVLHGRHQVGEGRVHRVRGGLQQGDVAVVDVGVVVHDHRVAGGGEGAAVEGRAQPEALFQAGEQRPGLEGGRRWAGGGRPVDLRGQVIGAAVERVDLAGADGHRGDGDVQVVLGQALGGGVRHGTGRVVLSGLDGRVLHGRVERRGDLQATPGDLLVSEAGIEQFTLDHRHEEAAGAAVGVVSRDRRGLGQGVVGGVVVRLADAVGLEHAVEHVLVALEQLGRGLVTVGRVERGGTVDEGREHR